MSLAIGEKKSWMMVFVLSVACFAVPIVAWGAKVEKFGSVPAMMKELKDFSQEQGRFKVLKKEPLHIQLSPTVVPRDLPEVIDAQVKRAVIYGIYRSFVHTSIDKITVTAIPQERNLRTDATRYLPAYKRTVTKTRAEALALVRRHIRVTTFDALIGDQRIGDLVVPGQWTSAFNRLYYQDQGPPGLTRFFSDLEQ